MNNVSYLPELPLHSWEKSKETLHLYVQIVGKISLKLAPKKNHWWHTTLHVNSRGLTSGPIPYGQQTFEINFNFIDHRLEIITSKGEQEIIPLHHGLSVADFYNRLFKILDKLGIEADIVDKPYDLFTIKPFDQLTDVDAYSREHVHKYWRILLWADMVFKEFGGRFYGKTSPVNLYWHYMDLSVTRFSGKRGPHLDEAWPKADREAYSHEVISCGFMAGDEFIREPAFYSYTYPAPEQLDQQTLQPAVARWVESNGTPMAILLYEDLRKMPDPRATLLEFMESAYQAGATLAGWDVSDLEAPD